MNTDQQKIRFRKKRDFGDIINTTFAFLKQNFKPLFKGALFIAGPAILIGSIISGLAVQGVMYNEDYSDPTTTIGAMGKFGLSYFFIAVGMVFFYATVLSYLKLYLHKDTERDEITVTQIWQASKSKILPLLGLSIILFILIMLGFILFVIPGIYLALALSFSGVILVIEDRGVFESISRSVKIIGGHWWSTFGLMFVVSLITTVVSYAFMIPLYIVLGVIGINSAQDPAGMESATSVFSIISVIYMPLYYLVVTMLSAITITALVLKYFSIVEEKESVGTIKEIESLGTKESTA